MLCTQADQRFLAAKLHELGKSAHTGQCRAQFVRHSSQESALSLFGAHLLELSAQKLLVVANQRAEPGEERNHKSHVREAVQQCQ